VLQYDVITSHNLIMCEFDFPFSALTLLVWWLEGLYSM